MKHVVSFYVASKENKISSFNLLQSWNFENLTYTVKFGVLSSAQLGNNLNYAAIRLFIFFYIVINLMFNIN